MKQRSDARCSMAIKNTDSDHGGSKTFLLNCDECAFERTVTGRERATRVGASHRRETDHELVAVEVPLRIESR